MSTEKEQKKKFFRSLIERTKTKLPPKAVSVVLGFNNVVTLQTDCPNPEPDFRDISLGAQAESGSFLGEVNTNNGDIFTAHKLAEDVLNNSDN
ncbi:hypothetical protein [Capybara microvirus Cap3_SP_393]|nr:hypothetical protein [Capybara microvirus Cap3_SP_393]